MTKQMVLKKIEAIGLTEPEAAVYLAALETGTAPASEIARTAGLNRVTTYGLLMRLKSRGAIAVSSRGKAQVFTAADPEHFIADARQRADDLAGVLPQLLAMAGNHPVRPKVRVFEGIEGVQAAYRESLAAKSEILNYANSQNIRAHWPTYDADYVRVRADQKIFLRGLAPDDVQGRRVKAGDADFHRETRLLPKKHFWVENEIKIWDDKFLIASFEPQVFAVIIESPPMVETQRQIFGIAWEYAGK